MKPHHNLAETRTPDGARLSLHEHDGSYCVRLNGQDLMHSSTSASEVLLGELAHALIDTKAPTRTLIGGMGLGYTLKAVLAKAGPKAVVEIGELMREVIEWNRTFMAKLNGHLLEDPRVHVKLGDVVATIQKTRPNSYDAILLDVTTARRRWCTPAMCVFMVRVDWRRCDPNCGPAGGSPSGRRAPTTRLKSACAPPVLSLRRFRPNYSRPRNAAPM